jgi:hypothetical protein
VRIDGIDSRVRNDTVSNSDVEAVVTQSLLLHARFIFERRRGAPAATGFGVRGVEARRRFGGRRELTGARHRAQLGQSPLHRRGDLTSGELPEAGMLAE